MTKPIKKEPERQDGLPEGFNPFEVFKSTAEEGQLRVGAKLEKLQASLFKDIKDFFRVHPGAEYTTPPLCLVNVPMPSGRDALHLIAENLLDGNAIPAARIIRCKLVLATRPDNAYFLGIVKIRNLDNAYNRDTLDAVERSKSGDLWVKITTYEDGRAGYSIAPAEDQDFVDPPTWPTQSMQELVMLAFRDRMILDRNHPGYLRLTGRRQRIG